MPKVANLGLDQKLLRLPAHKPAAAIGDARFSNGTRLSGSDWRANRPVDMLAKTAATHFSCERDVINLLESAEAATAHAACCLGIDTHAANNHQIVTIGDAGAEVTKVVRDAVDKSRVEQVHLGTCPCGADASYLG